MVISTKTRKRWILKYTYTDGTKRHQYLNDMGNIRDRIRQDDFSRINLIVFCERRAPNILDEVFKADNKEEFLTELEEVMKGLGLVVEVDEDG